LFCPFCAEEINDSATVCKHCHRDLVVQKHLLDKNRELLEENKDLKQQLASLKSKLAFYSYIEKRSVAASGSRNQWQYIGAFLVLPVILLLLVHYLMIIKFDARPIYLRIVSIIIPSLFGFGLLWSQRASATKLVFTAVFVGVAAVSGMFWAVSVVDQVPILPQDARDWQEAIEYALSIGLAIVTGYLMARLITRAMSDDTEGPIDMFAHSIVSLLYSSQNQQEFKDRIESVQRLLTTVVAVAATLGSIYAGVKSVLN
jgi:hypothetical protein